MNISASSSYIPQRPDAASLFKSTDANGDGKITQDELTTALASRGQSANGSTQGPDAEDLFSKLDADGDGAITETEHEAGLAAMEAHHGAEPSGESSGGASLVDTLKQLLAALDQKDTVASDDSTAADNAAATAAAPSESSTADLDKLIKQLVAELKKNSETTSVLRTTA